MLNVMVLEDCVENKEALETMIRSISNDIHVFSVSTKKAAKELIESAKTFDLFFLDINLEPNKTGDISGIEFAKEIRFISGYEFTPIVFVTSLASLEILSYRETQCYRYLIKPYQKEEVLEIVHKVINYKKEKKEKQITIKKDGINYRIKTSDIVFLKAVPRGVELKLVHETVFVKYFSLKQILEEIGLDFFVQCHRMYAININYMEYADLVNRMIKMKGYQEIVEIGVTYKNVIRSLIHE